ncbi:GntR family transcriptional regulator [Paenibacillus elgii]|uniref:GntR family transcriptional regulator n=1 Tax=Paenibacillus elgii TaxID=189691 RepID=A0A2T6G1N7_9BACL|nr:PLP-dependent aminotransferase family protein [Paenibacillus elgii]PUA38046.1 GntR family transcriptional regulator [Paenibacillus elgii]
MSKIYPSAAQPARLYESVCDDILKRIDRGEWNELGKLPSIRELAQELGVHRLTVFKAYQLLKQSGKAYVKDKSGYYLNTGSLPSDLTAMPAVHSHIQQNPLSDIQRVPVFYQFSQALLDPNLLPNQYLSAYVKQAFDLYPKVLGTYAPVQGDAELREAMTEYLATQHRLSLTPGELLITSGAQQALDLLAKTLLKPRDVVLVERPTYGAAMDIFRSYGAQLASVDIHPHGYDLEQVARLMKERKPRFFYLNPTFHNPTGYTVSAEQRKRLVELAAEHRCLLVEDDAFHDIYFKQPPPPPLFAYDTEGYVAYIRSFSKYIAPGLRIAAVAARQPVIGNLLTAKSLADNGTPLLNQKIFLLLFFSDRMQRHLEKLRIALHVRMSIMEEALSGTGLSWTKPAGGLNLWIKLPDGIKAGPLLAKGIEQSLTFVPGTICDPLAEFDDRIRLSYSYANENQLREGVRLLAGLLRSLA